MNISILGGGNIGMCLLGEISRVKGYDVTIYTSKADLFDDKILVEDLEKKITFSSGPIKATKHMDEAIRDADIILCTIPSFLRKNIVSQVSKYIKPEACLGFFPAYGGAELYCGELIGKGVTIFGLQKVPYVARTKEVGKVAGLWSKKNQLYIASLPGSNIDKIKDFLEETLQISCEVLPNYLAVTLLPGNPLLHTSGSYVLLHNHHEKDIFPYQIYYYQSWDDSCSEMICKMSDEMEAVCKALPLDMSGVQSIQTYYESPTPTDLTRKFHSIPSFHDLTLPMIKTRGGYLVDYNSRFYTEDIPFGLAAIHSLGMLADVTTPNIDRIIRWYSAIAGKEYIKADGSLGKDANETATLQVHGITNIKSLIEFYEK